MTPYHKKYGVVILLYDVSVITLVIVLVEVVVTGETLYMARRKCPKLKSYPPDYYFYKQIKHRYIK